MCAIVGLVLDAISFIAFSFASMGGVVLGVVSILEALKAKRSEENATLELVLAIISLIIGAIFFFFWLYTLLTFGGISFFHN